MKFIHFGCWNNGQCSSDGTNGLSLAMQKLNSYVKENSVDFITVAGDNYYPPKGSTGKKFIIEDFSSGFNCLPSTVKKYLIFGNHDIEDVVIDETKLPVKCKILDKQIEIAEEDDSVEIFNDVLFKVINNTLIIMLDTNLYDRKIVSTPISETCYSKLFNSLVKKSELTLGDLIGYQNCFVKNILQSNSEVNNVIFIGHHPIYSIKNKSGSKNAFKLSRFIDFFKQISSLLIGKKIYYLCADTHMYQEGTIRILPDLEIKQYVVGTGGAEQDKIYEPDNTIVEDGIQVYTKSNEKKEFGFLTVDINDSGLNFEFISANQKPVGMVGGSLKKYKILNKKIMN
jgi:hypothetical protein